MSSLDLGECMTKEEFEEFLVEEFDEEENEDNEEVHLQNKSSSKASESEFRGDYHDHGAHVR